MNWYYEQAGQRQGPVPDSEIDRLLASGEITDATLVWRDGMAGWTPLGEARPASAGRSATPGEAPPEGWIRCSATGKYFPPSEIVYLDGKPYSAASKASVMQGVIESGALPADIAIERNGPPWEQRAQLGLIKAGWETIKAVLTAPSETFAAMKRDGGLGSPLLFAVIFGSFGSIVGLVYQAVIQMRTAQVMPPEAQQIPGLNGMSLSQMTMGAVIGMAILMPIFTAISCYIGAGILHLSLMICSGAKQSFETTFRAYCYVQGAAGMLQVVPFCGAMVSGIWALVCLCIGLSKTHEISVGRAVFAVLLPTVLCCVAIFVIVGAVFGTIMAAQGVRP